MRLSSRVHDTQWGVVFCKPIVLQTLGLDSSCAGPLWGWQWPPYPTPAQHTWRVLLCLLSVFKSLPMTFGRQRPGSREWWRWRGRGRGPIGHSAIDIWLMNAGHCGKDPLEVEFSQWESWEILSCELKKKNLKTLCFFRRGENYVLCISLLKIKMQRQYFHIEKAKQEENSFKLFRGKMNWAFPIRLKYLKH